MINWKQKIAILLVKIPLRQNGHNFNVKYTKILSFSGSRGSHGPDLPSPFGRKFQLSVRPGAFNCILNSLVNTHISSNIRLLHYTTGHHGLCQIKQRWNETSFPEQSVCKGKGVKQWNSLLGM